MNRPRIREATMTPGSNTEARILVVEDSRVQALSLSKVLNANGFHVEVARDGLSGLQAFSTSRFDLVLSDVQMSGIDGYELCRRIKQSPGGEHVPVIMLTHLSGPLDIIRGLQSGADAYISKPCEDEHLLGRIRDILENRRLRVAQADDDAVDFSFSGKRFSLKCEKPQVVSFLAAAFEDLIRASKREQQAQATLLQEKRRLELHAHHTREQLLLEQSRGLRDASLFLQATLDALVARIAILDSAGRIVAVNAAWGDQEGAHPLVGSSCPVGTNYLEKCLQAGRNGMAQAHEIASAVASVVAVKQSGTYLEYPCRVSGEDRWFGVHIGRFRDSAPAHIVVAHEEITQRKEAEERLFHHAFHDPLTGLSNRALFEQHLGQAIERCREQPGSQFAVLFLDFDGFKLINDSLGHTIGDRLLVAISRRLESSLRRTDKIARLGGDEFVILIEEAHDLESVTKFAEALLERLRDSYSIDGHEVFITASVGIAMNPVDLNGGPRNILRDADMAMYHAKGSGRGRYAVFDRALHDRAVARLNLESDLRRSIEHGELRVHYQPIISLQTGVIAGFEALARWRHPTRGSIEPQEFVPIAEETGLILPLGSMVLHEACRWLRAWQIRQPGAFPLTMSVNLSGRQLEQPDFVDQVNRILRDTGVDPSNLRLEVTESVAMRDAERATDTLQRLKGLGIRVSLDDFGTGYSSLNHLHRLPIDILKIDRSFVSRIDVGGRDWEIVRTIIMLAQRLRMDVVAEGVETVVQCQWLRNVNCHYGQGHYFSQALDGEEALSLLDSSSLIAPPGPRDGRLWLNGGPGGSSDGAHPVPRPPHQMMKSSVV